MIFSTIQSRKKEIIFSIILIIIFYRSPHILLNGRFGAEEGAVFFANAYKNGFFYSFFFVDFRSGYLNFWANFSGIFANIFTLKLAPLASNYLALIPKLLIFYFILYKESYLLKDFKYKSFLCFLILLSPFNVPEIWLNSINSQIFFCILSFLILLSKNEKESLNFFNLLLIFLAGFSGLYTCVLLPIFFFKYLKFKTLQDKFNLIILFFCTIIQFFIVVYSKVTNILYEGKLHEIDINLIYNYFYNVPIKAFFGRNLTQFVYHNINISLELAFILSLILYLIVITFLIYYFKKNATVYSYNKFIINSLLYSFLSISILVLVGAAGSYVGGRYAAIPSFFLLTIVLFFAMIIKKKNIKYLLHIILFISVLSGAYEFKNNNKYKKFLLCIDCPNWIHEVKKFKENNEYPLNIWPYPRKRMRLN